MTEEVSCHALISSLILGCCWCYRSVLFVVDYLSSRLYSGANSEFLIFNRCWCCMLKIFFWSILLVWRTFMTVVRIYIYFCWMMEIKMSNESEKGKYQCLVAKLIYLTLTRPDNICYKYYKSVYAYSNRCLYVSCRENTGAIWRKSRKMITLYQIKWWEHWWKFKCWLGWFSC